MTLGTKTVWAAVGVLLVAGLAQAEEKLGVAVYPGAKVNAEATEIVRQLGSDGTCYQTGDPLAKVVDFYKKQAGLKPLTPPPGVESPAKVFQKGGDIQVRIQPYPPKPTEVHVCIVKE